MVEIHSKQEEREKSGPFPTTGVSARLAAFGREKRVGETGLEQSIYIMNAATTEFDTVRAKTDPQVLQRIDGETEERIRFYATQPRDVISHRIEELEGERDIEQMLEKSAAGIALGGIVLGLVRRKWLLLSATALGFMLQHATQGWCAPVTFLRKMGIRTRREIDREKYALKILRGDFQAMPSDPEELKKNPAGNVLNMVS